MGGNSNVCLGVRLQRTLKNREACLRFMQKLKPGMRVKAKFLTVNRDKDIRRPLIAEVVKVYDNHIALRNIKTGVRESINIACVMCGETKIIVMGDDDYGKSKTVEI